MELLWGLVAGISAITACVIARRKRRGLWWAVVCFLVPIVICVLFLLPSAVAEGDTPYSNLSHRIKYEWRYISTVEKAVAGGTVLATMLLLFRFFTADPLSLGEAQLRAAKSCAEAEQHDLNLAEMVRRDSAELASATYVPVEKREQMARDEATQRDVAATDHSTCQIYRDLEQFMIELAALRKRYDLSRMRSYAPAERRAIFAAADVPSDGPRSPVEELRVLRVLRDRPELYK